VVAKALCFLVRGIAAILTKRIHKC